MLKLLKYEFRKTMFPKLILLAAFVIMEGIFLYGHWTGKEDTKALGMGLVLFTLFFSFLLLGILSLVTLHKDMNTRQGYMLFMTPNSTYRILGAKVAECGLSLLIAGAIGLGIGALNFSMLSEVTKLITSLLENFGSNLVPDFPTLSSLLFNILSHLLCSVTTAYLADVISSSLLNGRKGNLAITFVLFILINYAVQKILTLVPDSLGVVPVFLLQGGIALVLAGIMYVITARLMERYLSV